MEKVEKLSRFLSSDIRKDILEMLWRSYDDKLALAIDVGCPISTINRRGVSDKFDRVLSLSLEKCHDVKGLIEKEFLEFESLCKALGILNERGGINKFISVLDEKSKKILWHLYKNRHANIDELACLIDAKNHAEVLIKIREVINPTSQRILGKPILKFEESKIDNVTGEKIPFSWWLAEEVQIIRGGLIDVFDERDGIVIVADLQSTKLSNPVEISKAIYNNGVLEIVLKKEKG